MSGGFFASSDHQNGTFEQPLPTLQHTADPMAQGSFPMGDALDVEATQTFALSDLNLDGQGGQAPFSDPNAPLAAGDMMTDEDLDKGFDDFFGGQ